MQRTLTNRTRKATQIKLCNVIAAPVLMCGSENCALNRSERRKTERAETGFLRHVSGCTCTDHARSTTVRSQLQIYIYICFRKKKIRPHVQVV
jgi:hypothetical protein